MDIIIQIIGDGFNGYINCGNKIGISFNKYDYNQMGIYSKIVPKWTTVNKKVYKFYINAEIEEMYNFEKIDLSDPYIGQKVINLMKNETPLKVIMFKGFEKFKNLMEEIKKDRELS